MNTYAPGAGVDLFFYFRDATGALSDATAATLEVEKADGTIQSYALVAATHVSLGVYKLRIVVDNTPGRWYYRGVGTGNLICATLDQSFYVERTRFPA